MDLAGTRKHQLPVSRRALVNAYALGLASPEQAAKARKLIEKDESARALYERAKKRIADREKPADKR